MIENGYTVIRVGNIVKEPIDFQHSKLIDYHLLKINQNYWRVIF